MAGYDDGNDDSIDDSNENPDDDIDDGHDGSNEAVILQMMVKKTTTARCSIPDDNAADYSASAT